jgi:hypothetical protein
MIMTFPSFNPLKFLERVITVFDIEFLKDLNI